ncbi:helix-turn-helix domain-containing protein [Tabrizicola sp.]|uniref:TetR/AcrR family transcriptional regulator n=1 Tax=Tabrizicola sp. TaxID=2005166 RepID=UPI00286C0CA1|nr:helix-turn-helix domain-containing protein [Tabrizicola sp.]
MSDVTVLRPARTATRERILAAAHDAIIDKGFEATSVEEIAAAVGISRAGFFYHFPDKNALARALIDTQIVEEGEMLAGIMARAADLSDDPLQQMLIAMRLMAERYHEFAGGYAGCILASAIFQDRLFDAEVKAANRRAQLAFRDRFVDHFAAIAAAYPPVDPVDPGEMADHLNAVITGGIVVSRGLRDPQVLVQQLLLARQMVKAIYTGR